MLELDAVVRANQLNCLPFSRSGRADAELFENHPELLDRIDLSKRVKIDAATLHSRLREKESRQGAATKFKVDLFDDFAPSSSAQKDQRRKMSRDHNSSPKSPSLLAQRSPVLAASKSPLLAPSQSPLLSARKSSTDLMFEMEDHDDGKGDFQTPKRRHRRTTDSPGQQSTGLGLEDDVEFPSPGAIAALSTSGKSPSLQNAFNGTKGQDQGRSISHEHSSWKSSAFQNLKFDKNEAISQPLFGGTISSSLTNLNTSKSSPSISLPTKMSQKERKRQLQTQQTSQINTAMTAIQDTESMDRNLAPKTPASPWHTASRGAKVNLKELLDTEKYTSIPPKPPAVRAPSPMTLRQTVSGKPSLAQRSVSGPARSMTTPVQQQQPTSFKSTSTPPQSTSSSTPPTIHSIRHHYTPAPEVEPTLQLSMADILAQQNREKELIKEAAAKRSLQEIQEEQAFQEWWDLESRKAREEEAEAAAAAAVSSVGAGPRRGKSRGGGRGRSRTGRGGKEEATKGKRKEEVRHGSGGESSQKSQKGGSATSKKSERGVGLGGRV